MGGPPVLPLPDDAGGRGGSLPPGTTTGGFAEGLLDGAGTTPRDAMALLDGAAVGVGVADATSAVEGAVEGATVAEAAAVTGGASTTGGTSTLAFAAALRRIPHAKPMPTATTTMAAARRPKMAMSRERGDSAIDCATGSPVWAA